MKAKKAFTIIEIIFIIVIISVLAVVALPRLSLTRDDAKITIVLNEVGTLITDLSAYYTTRDFFSASLEDMTYIKDVNFSRVWNSTTQSGRLTYYTSTDDNTPEECIHLFIQNSEGNITIVNALNPSGTICKGVQSIDSYKNLLGTKLVGGNRIQF